MAYRVVWLRGMLSAALEASSLPSSGIVTPITTPTTNLSLFRQSKRQGLSSSWAKRHALRGPRDKAYTFFRSRYSNNYSDYQPLFRQSQRHGLSSSLAKRHALRGPRDKISTIFRSGYSNNYFECQPFFVLAKSMARPIE